MSSPSEIKGGGTAKIDKKGRKDCTKNENFCVDKRTDSNRNNASAGNKIPYNPEVHAIKSENTYKAKNCFRKREKQKKIKK